METDNRDRLTQWFNAGEIVRYFGARSDAERGQVVALMESTDDAGRKRIKRELARLAGEQHKPRRNVLGRLILRTRRDGR